MKDPSMNPKALARRARAKVAQRRSLGIPFAVPATVEAAFEQGVEVSLTTLKRALKAEAFPEGAFKLRQAIEFLANLPGVEGEVGEDVVFAPSLLDDPAAVNLTVRQLGFERFMETVQAVYRNAKTAPVSGLSVLGALIGDLKTMNPKTCPDYFQRLSGVCLALSHVVDRRVFAAMDLSIGRLAYRRVLMLRRMLRSFESFDFGGRSDADYFGRANAYLANAMAFIGFFFCAHDRSGIKGQELVWKGNMDSVRLARRIMPASEDYEDREGLWNNVLLQAVVAMEMDLGIAQPMSGMVSHAVAADAGLNPDVQRAVELAEHQPLIRAWDLAS